MEVFNFLVQKKKLPALVLQFPVFRRLADVAAFLERYRDDRAQRGFLVDLDLNGLPVDYHRQRLLVL